MKYFITAFLVSFLCGCIPAGTTQTVPVAMTQIPAVSVTLQLNKTTKAKVIEALGAPQSLSTHGSGKYYNEGLTYHFYPSHGRPRAVVRIVSPDGMVYDSSPRTLILYFTNGVLDHIS